MDKVETVEKAFKEDEKSLLKVLIAKGKEQGFLTYGEVNDHLPDGIVEPEQIEDIVNMINDMGIKVYETPPDLDGQITDNTDVPDEDAAAEAAAPTAHGSVVSSLFGTGKRGGQPQRKTLLPRAVAAGEDFSWI